MATAPYPQSKRWDSADDCTHCVGNAPIGVHAPGGSKRPVGTCDGTQVSLHKMDGLTRALIADGNMEEACIVGTPYAASGSYNNWIGSTGAKNLERMFDLSIPVPYIAQLIDQSVHAGGKSPAAPANLSYPTGYDDTAYLNDIIDSKFPKYSNAWGKLQPDQQAFLTRWFVTNEQSAGSNDVGEFDTNGLIYWLQNPDLIPNASTSTNTTMQGPAPVTNPNQRQALMAWDSVDDTWGNWHASYYETDPKKLSELNPGMNASLMRDSTYEAPYPREGWRAPSVDAQYHDPQKIAVHLKQVTPHTDNMYVVVGAMVVAAGLVLYSRKL